jgi:cell division protein FtsB
MGQSKFKPFSDLEAVKRGRSAIGAILEHKPSPLVKRTAIALFFVLVLLFIGYLFLSEDGLARNSGLGEKKALLESQNRRLEEENRQLMARRARLLNDPQFLESEVRKKLGLVRPDEIIYRLAEEPDLTDEEVKEQLE